MATRRSLHATRSSKRVDLRMTAAESKPAASASARSDGDERQSRWRCCQSDFDTHAIRGAEARVRAPGHDEPEPGVERLGARVRSNLDGADRVRARARESILQQRPPHPAAPVARL